MREEKYLLKLRKQGSGLHVYFSTEILRNPKFKLKDGEVVLIRRTEDGVDIRKVDIDKL
jgi:hypothetical protein